MATRSKTANRGAADIIGRAIAKIGRMQKESGCSMIDGNKFKAWLSDWDVRAAKKAGGLGRK